MGNFISEDLGPGVKRIANVFCFPLKTNLIRWFVRTIRQTSPFLISSLCNLNSVSPKIDYPDELNDALAIGHRVINSMLIAIVPTPSGALLQDW